MFRIKIYLLITTIISDTIIFITTSFSSLKIYIFNNKLQTIIT